MAFRRKICFFGSVDIYEMKLIRHLFIGLLCGLPLSAAKVEPTIARACESVAVLQLAPAEYRRHILELADKHPQSINAWLPQESTLFTPLQYAIQRKDAELVRELLQRGAIPYRPHTGYEGDILKDYYGRWTENVEISQLVKAEQNRYNLFDIVLCSHEYFLKQREKGLIAPGYQEDFYTLEEGPVNAAILAGEPADSVRRLVQQHPDAVNRVSYLQGTPCTTLQLALRLGDEALVQALLDAGAVPFACSGGEEDILLEPTMEASLRTMVRKAQRRYSLLKLVEASEAYRYREDYKSDASITTVQKQISGYPIILLVQLHSVRSQGGNSFYTTVEDIGTVLRCYKGNIPEGASITLLRGVENAERKQHEPTETQTSSTCIYAIESESDVQRQEDGSLLITASERIFKSPRFIERTWKHVLEAHPAGATCGGSGR